MKTIRFFLPRLEYVLLTLLFWGVATNGPKLLNFDGDLPRHLLLGQIIRETRNVPTTDTFSFRTQGFASIPHEWLSQVLLSIANDWLGLSGVVLLTAIVVTLVWVIVYRDAARRSNDILITLLVTAVGISVSMIHVLPRPHLFTYLFVAIWILVLERIREGKIKLWWLLPVMMVIWVNLHGMFVLGIMLLGIYLAGSWLEQPSWNWFSRPFAKSLLLSALLSIFATFFSPSGLHIWGAIASLGSNAYITSRIPEYQSADFHMPETWPIILLVVWMIIGFARNMRKSPWAHILLVAAFAAVALYTSRMLPLFAIVSVPVIAENLSSLVRQEFPHSKYILLEKNTSAMNEMSNGWVWLIAAVVAVTGIFQSGHAIDPEQKGNVFDTRFFPVQAVMWLNEHPQDGHMFNEFDWGGYLLLKLSPRQQIFMDGHTHIYGETLTREYETVIGQYSGWQDILEKYQIQWTIVRAGSSIANALQELGWNIIYQDETAFILHKP